MTWHFCKLEPFGVNGEDGICPDLSIRLKWELKTIVSEAVLGQSRRAVHISGAMITKAEDKFQMKTPTSSVP